ncbi:MAG TPA: IclR family transcriptional regulator [Burkholderiales bacterium]|nr:IclR family transcriptional regulator [Burkholderiales bacterium]
MKKQQGVQGVEIGLRLAFALARSPGPMALKELARAAKLPASKAHRYLVSLCRAGMVRQDGPNGRYDLGTGALELGLAAQRRLDEFRLAEEAIGELYELTGLTVGLVVWGDHGPTVVRRKEGTHPVTVSTRVGSNMSVIRTNAGRLFAAFLPKVVTAPFIEAEFRTGGPVLDMGKAIDRAGFEQVLARVREQRLCRNRGDTVAGIDAVSAPVFDHDGRIVMVMSIMGARGAIDLALDSPPVKQLVRVSNELSLKLGAARSTIQNAF